MDQDQPTRMHEQTAPAAEKTCPSCGEELGEDQRFCEACGFKVDDPAATIGAAGVEEDPLGRLARLWPLIAVIWVVLAVLAWWWIYGRAIVID